MFRTPEECERREFINSNPRYKNFCQTHFTAGDEEQFEETRDRLSLRPTRHGDKGTTYWDGYNGVSSQHVLTTFRYIFNKFKKGIFISIKNNKVQTFLPFSKAKFVNEWSDQIKIDPRFPDTLAFFKHVSDLDNRPFIEHKINKVKSRWYGNNCLVRYEFPQSENDTGIHHMKSMFEDLCAAREVPDIEFFVNRRDFPLLTRDGTEPYEDMWDSVDKPLMSHKYDKYIPILSSTTTDRHADIAIPTLDDWARIKFADGYYFPKTQHRDYNDVFGLPWEQKKPIAVFRGASTGKGTTIETNPRLKIAYLSTLGKVDTDGVVFLDAGITDWNTRPRKIMGNAYLQTVEINELPFGLIKKLTPLEQSGYKYIIHLDGHSAAFRLSLEMSMNSVILKADSSYRLWFSHLLKPYIHYVPLKADLSDVYEKIVWCKQNDDACKKIAENARLFYLQVLSKDGVLDHLQNMIYTLRNTVEYDYPPNIIDIRIEEYIKSVHCIEVEGCGNLPILTTTKLSTIYGYGEEKVVKYTVDKKKIKENIHEAYIGTRYINYLRRHSPHFIKTHGLVANNKAVVSDYVPNSTTFMEWLGSREFNFDAYICLLYQICLGLQVAQRAFEFVHNDLFPWNILISHNNDPYECVLENGVVVCVKSKTIPVIIDYGKSRVAEGVIRHGFINNERFSTIYDVICILLSSLNIIFRAKQLRHTDDSDMLKLINFISKTAFCPKQFTSFPQARQFVFDNSSFSSMLVMELYELETLTPVDFCNHLKTNFACVSSIITINSRKQLLFRKPKTSIKKIIEKCSWDDKLFVYYFFQSLHLYIPDVHLSFVVSEFKKKLLTSFFNPHTLNTDKNIVLSVLSYSGVFELMEEDNTVLIK